MKLGKFYFMKDVDELNWHRMDMHSVMPQSVRELLELEDHPLYAPSEPFGWKEVRVFFFFLNW